MELAEKCSGGGVEKVGGCSVCLCKLCEFSLFNRREHGTLRISIGLGDDVQGLGI